MATETMDSPDSNGFIQRFEEVVGEIRSHPLASPLEKALKKTSVIVDQLDFVLGASIITPIIKGALWVAVKGLHPDALDAVKTDVRKEFSGVLGHLEQIEDQMADVHKLVQATFKLQVDERFKSGLEQIGGAYTTFLKSGSNLDGILTSMEATLLPFQSNANASFDMAKIKQYLEVVKKFQGMDFVDATFSYIIDIRAKYLLMMTQFFIFKKNPEKVVQKFQEFNKFYEDVRIVYSGINDVAAALEEAYKSGGEEAMRQMMEKHLNRWRDQKVNFAVTGGSGVGKSSFINCIRGLKAIDSGAAKIGVTETTMQVAMYDFPENSNIKVWDLPGLGTKSFPREKYFNMIDAQLGKLQKGLTFDSFDSHMVFSASRFTENDHFIAKRVNSLGKKLIYARTQIDIDIVKNEENYDIPEEETIDSVRKACEENLKGVKYKELFLISTKLTRKDDYRNKWDFPALYDHIFDTLSDLQKEAFLLSVQVENEKMVRQKVKVLKERIPWRNAEWLAAVFPSSVGMIPLMLLGGASCAAGGLARAAGFDKAGDFLSKTGHEFFETIDNLPFGTVIHNEVLFQRDQLDIGDKSIENLVQDAGKTKQEIMRTIDISTGPRSNPKHQVWSKANLYKELAFNEESAKKKIQLLNKLQKKNMK